MATSTVRTGPGKTWLACVVLLTGVLLVLFFRSFNPALVQFSNDGPLGSTAAAAIQPTSSFTGVWSDLNWLGANAGSHLTSPSYLLLWLLGPVGFAKFYGPTTLLLLGLGAW